jgi:vancomycin permeability regulator SanA
MNKRGRWRTRMLIALFMAILIPLALIGYVALSTSARRYRDPAITPAAPVAIVFGAGIGSDGTLSPMLADRVRAAAQLYQDGAIQKILMTGDNSRADYDEVSAMRRAAIARGVAADDITLDYAGFSTYESCYRARAIFGVTRAVLVTQDYHLPRALYTCQHLGLDVEGLGTPDWENYPLQIMGPYSARESLAILKALWQIHITRPLPTFLGPFEGIR